jgi:hypothetical protein
MKIAIIVNCLSKTDIFRDGKKGNLTTGLSGFRRFARMPRGRSGRLHQPVMHPAPVPGRQTLILFKNPAETVDAVIPYKPGNFTDVIGSILQQFLGPPKAQSYQIFMGRFIVHPLETAGELPDAQHAKRSQFFYRDLLHVVVVDIINSGLYPAVLPGYRMILDQVADQSFKNTIQEFPAVKKIAAAFTLPSGKEAVKIPFKIHAV